jgi:hypothetical protein
VASPRQIFGEVRLAYLNCSKVAEQAWSGAEATRSVVDGRNPSNSRWTTGEGMGLGSPRRGKKFSVGRAQGLEMRKELKRAGGARIDCEDWSKCEYFYQDCEFFFLALNLFR